jgi:aarF domain-containing kinase
VLDVFAEQVFVHGFLHSDPHGANAFIRPVKVGAELKPQLVLLDHGLYRTLKPEFQDNYANLWRALVLRNSKDVEKYARALGAGEHYKVLSLLLTWRPFNFSKVGMSGGMTQADLSKIFREFHEATPNISRMLEGVDRGTLFCTKFSFLFRYNFFSFLFLSELLLVLRTQTILRGINVDLGGRVNRYKVTARAAIRGFHLRNSTSALAYWWETVTLEFKFWLADTIMALSAWLWPPDEAMLTIAGRLGERF